MKVIEIDLADKIPALHSLGSYDGIYLLVRYRRQPVGRVTLKTMRQTHLSPEQLREALTEKLGECLLQAVLDRQVQPISAAKRESLPISVVVCTRYGADRLRGCVHSLLSLDYPRYEVIVVDIAPSNDDVARLTMNLPIRYVREERPGLEWARNRGVAEARGRIIAFTDDDARPDRSWLKAISCAFTEKDVMAVTGPVIPAELETQAQILFELRYGGMGGGFLARSIKRHKVSLRELLWLSAFGAGCNMAFRREIFKSVGLFDVALDVGTPGRVVGDIEMFHRIIARGHMLAFEPSALVRYLHRRDMAALAWQMLRNGRGFGCYLLNCARNRNLGRRSILSFAVREWFCDWILSRLIRPGIFPRHLVMAELAGMLSSPLAYRASRAQARREHKRELSKIRGRIHMPVGT